MNYIDMHCDTLAKAAAQQKKDGRETKKHDGGCEKTAPVWRKGTVFCHVFTAEKRRKLE